MRELSINVMNWFAWAPGVETREDWQLWAKNSSSIKILDEGSPSVDFLKPLFRRRLSGLSKMSLKVAHECLEDIHPSSVSSVFGSRYGEISTTVQLIKDIAEQNTISPTKFSLSVHNTSSGLFSIAMQNKIHSTAVSGGLETFCYTMLEAIGILGHSSDSPVLLVMADESLPKMYDEFREDNENPYAVALLLGHANIGPGIQLRINSRNSSNSCLANGPQALSFIKWLLADQKSLIMSGLNHDWRWTRV